MMQDQIAEKNAIYANECVNAKLADVVQKIAIHIEECANGFVVTKHDGFLGCVGYPRSNTFVTQSRHDVLKIVSELILAKPC